MVTGLLFASSYFFLTWITPLQSLKYAYGPALMIVGVLMLAPVRHIDWDDFSEAVPAVVTISLVVFSFNIANGLTAGLILHPLMKLGMGKFREIHPGSVVLGLMCLAYHVYGLPH